MSSWYTLPNIDFYAGRYFTHDGVDYTPGQKLPDGSAQRFRNLEGAIRSRYLIPIAPDRHQIPRHMWGEVEAYEVVLRKHQERANRLHLPALDESSQEPSEGEVQAETFSEEEPNEAYFFDPAEHTIPEVLDYVDQNPSELERVLETELQGKNRSTLLTALEDRLTAPEA